MLRILILVFLRGSSGGSRPLSQLEDGDFYAIKSTLKKDQRYFNNFMLFSLEICDGVE